MGVIKISKSKFEQRLMTLLKIGGYVVYSACYVFTAWLVYNTILEPTPANVLALIFIGMIPIICIFGFEIILGKNSPLHKLNSILNLFEWTNGNKKKETSSSSKFEVTTFD